jgi:hypothetical protein
MAGNLLVPHCIGEATGLAELEVRRMGGDYFLWPKASTLRGFGEVVDFVATRLESPNRRHACDVSRTNTACLSPEPSRCATNGIPKSVFPEHEIST